MTEDFNYSFFTSLGKNFSPIRLKNPTIVPFKDHPQFSAIIDILNRKECHHIILCSDYSVRLRMSFLEAFLQFLNYNSIAQSFRDAELIHLGVDKSPSNTSVEEDFQNLTDRLNSNSHYQLLVLDENNPLKNKNSNNDEWLKKRLLELVDHPRCRLVILGNSRDHRYYTHLAQDFSPLQIIDPTETDILMLLKQQRLELENFHHVEIPEEILSFAFSLAQRYLNTNQPFEQALMLLDSSAAHVNRVENPDKNILFKPVVTNKTLAKILSDWIQIPACQLHLNKFKRSEFTQAMQQQLFGQENAIALMGNELQHAQANLQLQSGVFYSALFVGPAHSGKKAAASALVEYLFKQQNVLYVAQLSTEMPISLMDIKLYAYQQNLSLKLSEIITKMPYAVIMFESVEKASPTHKQQLQEILTTGFLNEAKSYNFQQATILLSTTIASDKIVKSAQSLVADDHDAEDMGLMQLVMGEPKIQTLATKQHCTPEDLTAIILPELLETLPELLCKQISIIPFLPLNKSAVEKILSQKVKVLDKQLRTRFGVELNCAREVVSFLTNEVFKKHKDNIVNVNKAIQKLHFCVEQALLSQADNKNRPIHLFLHLNETGELLQFDWLISPATTRHHTT